MNPEIQDHIKKGKIIIYPTDSIIVSKTWIRIPKHPFTLEILRSGKQSISTSVNEK